MSNKTFINLLFWFLVLSLIYNSNKRLYAQSSNPINEKQISALYKSSKGLEFLRVQNDVIAVQVSSDILYNYPSQNRVREKGLFNIGTAMDNITLLYQFPEEPWSSHFNIKLDDTFYSIDSYRTNCLRLPMILGPTIVENIITCTWSVRNVSIEQRLTPEQFSDTTGAVLIQYIIKNNDNIPHSVGLLLEMDTMINENDSAAIATNYGFSRQEQKYMTPDIPDFFQAYESGPVTPGLIAQGTLKGGNAVPPDVLIVGAWPDLVKVTWDYVPAGNLYGDSAVLLRWDDKPLAPGETRIIGAYYGIGEVSLMPGRLSLSVSSQTALQYVNNKLYPNPFFINLLVTNTGYSDARDVLGTIHLPSGLNLALQEQETKGINPANNNLLHPDSSRLVSWQVFADLPQQDTTVTFTIAVFSSNVDSNAISRQIFIPTPFILSAMPPSCSIVASDAASFNISIQNSTGFNASIDLTASGLPDQIDHFFDPILIDLNITTVSVLMIKTNSTTSPGTYPIRIAGRFGEFSQSDTVFLHIISPPDFILNVEPVTQPVRAGESVQYKISIDTLCGFNEAVNLSLTGLPESIHRSFCKTSIRADEISFLTLSTDLELASGNYDFLIEGSSSFIDKTANVVLIVQGLAYRVIPNPFTPNGDGFNDFVLFNYPEILNNQGTISIFNFQGRKVKELIAENRWYGKNDDGEELPGGVYLYILTIGGKINANGTITLIH